MIQGWVCYIMYYVVFILLILNFFVEKKKNDIYYMDYCMLLYRQRIEI